jgi:cell wall-associated NlpC family hydrolase
MSELDEREQVVKEALTWELTPYHENGDVKGAGVDCGMLLVRVFNDALGLGIPDPRPYPIQWAFHQKAERYLDIVESYAHEIQGPPAPGDVVVFKIGHCWAHGGIVVNWPEIIHANPPGDCRRDDWERSNQLRRLTPRFFSVWPRAK